MASLECDHCGGPAITSGSGLFGDGDGGKCWTCGFPGWVSIDDQEESDVCAWWRRSESDDARCNRDDCEDCKEARDGE